MGSLDSNGIYIYDETDNVAPLHTLLNLGQSSVGPALEDIRAHALIKPVANASDRDAYQTEMENAGTPPTSTSPLYVDRADTGQIERNRGAGWTAIYGNGQDLSVSGRGAALIGSGNPTQNGYFIQAGTIVITSSAGGGVTVNFPKPFPNGLVTVLTTNGHWTGGGGTLFMQIDQYSLSNFQYYLIGSDGQKKTWRQHRCNWLALGW